MISIAPLPRDRVDEVLHLGTGAGQEPFVGRIAEMVEETRETVDFHAIHRDGEAVGFFKIDRSYGLDSGFAETRDWGLRGFLIGAQYQGEGIARAALALLPDYLREVYAEVAGCIRLTVNCRNEVAQHVYLSGGWTDTGQLWHGGRAGPQHIYELRLRNRAEPA